MCFPKEIIPDVKFSICNLSWTTGLGVPRDVTDTLLHSNVTLAVDSSASTVACSAWFNWPFFSSNTLIIIVGEVWRPWHHLSPETVTSRWQPLDNNYISSFLCELNANERHCINWCEIKVFPSLSKKSPKIGNLLSSRFLPLIGHRSANKEILADIPDPSHPLVLLAQETSFCRWLCSRYLQPALDDNGQRTFFSFSSRFGRRQFRVRGKYVNLGNPSDTWDNNAGVAYKNSCDVVSQVADSERPVSPTWCHVGCPLRP